MSAQLSRATRASAHGPAGQGLTEFALVIGLFVFIVGALIQLALVLWAINTVTQVARDTARWAATQSTAPCESTPNRTAVAGRADAIARQLNLFAYRAGTWTTTTTVDATPEEGVGADWPIPVSGTILFATDCPPSDNQTAWFVRVRIRHAVPVFLPGLQFVLPPCGSGYCINSTAEVRMEPRAP